MMREHAQKGKTVFFSTHVFREKIMYNSWKEIYNEIGYIFDLIIKVDEDTTIKEYLLLEKRLNLN